jgi:hypothetical protein
MPESGERRAYSSITELRLWINLKVLIADVSTADPMR